MQPANQNELQAKIEARLRVIRTLWFGLFVSFGLSYLLTLFSGHQHEDVSPNRCLFIALAAAALLRTVYQRSLRPAAKLSETAIPAGRIF